MYPPPQSETVCGACRRTLPVTSCDWATCPHSRGRNIVPVSSMSGVEFESFVRHWLLANGFLRVETTPGSGDFGADLIAYRSATAVVGIGPCNACGRTLPVSSCDWQTCPHAHSGLAGKTVIQCKRSGSPVGIQAVQEVMGARSFYQASEAWVMSNAAFTPAAQRLAKASDVRLKQLRR
jgi:restriction system protein